MSESDDNFTLQKSQNEEYPPVMQPTGPSPRPPLPRMNGVDVLFVGGSPETRMTRRKVKRDDRLPAMPSSPRSPETAKSPKKEERDPESRGRVSWNEEFSEDFEESSHNESSIDRISEVSRSQSPPSRTSMSKHTCGNRTTRVGDKSKLSINHLVIGILTIVTIALSIRVALTHTDKNTGIESDETQESAFTQLLLDIKGVEKLFPSQERDVWVDIVVGIKDVVRNPKRPSIFLLLAKEDDTVICLARRIGKVASHALGGIDSMELTPAKLAKDTGHLIESLRDEITRKKAVILQDLLMINPEALKAFHYMCDSENPLVPEAVYLLIMRSDKYKESQPPLEFAEQQLNDSWSSVIDEHILLPLITRITGGSVLHIRTEKDVQCS